MRTITVASFTTPAKGATRPRSLPHEHILESLTNPPVYSYSTELASIWLSQLAYLGPGLTSNKVPGDFTWPGYNFGGVGFATFTGLADFKWGGEMVDLGYSIWSLDMYGFVGSSDNNKAIYVSFRGTVKSLLKQWILSDLLSLLPCSVANGCADKSICSNNAPAGSSGYKTVTQTYLVISWYCATLGLADISLAALGLIDSSCVKTQSVWDWGSCYSGLGFQQAGYNRLRDSTRSLVASLRTKYPSYDIVVTGHSLGGAMSTLAAADLRTQFPGNVILINHESPRALGPDAAGYVSGQLTQINRVTHCKDAAVHYPFKQWGWQHVTGEIFHQCPSSNLLDYSQAGTSVLGGFESTGGAVQYFKFLFAAISSILDGYVVGTIENYLVGIVNSLVMTPLGLPDLNKPITKQVASLLEGDLEAQHSMVYIGAFADPTQNPKWLVPPGSSLPQSPSWAPTLAPVVTPPTGQAFKVTPTSQPTSQPTRQQYPTKAPVSAAPTSAMPTAVPTTAVGYAVISATFDPTDTKCERSPLRTELKPLGGCDGPDGGQQSSLRADMVTGNIYVTYWDKTTTRCGGPSWFTSDPFTGSKCTCSATQCELNWLYSPYGTSAFVGAYQVQTIYSDAKCTAGNVITINAYAVPQVSPSCTAAACRTENGNTFTVDCVGSVPTSRCVRRSHSIASPSTPLLIPPLHCFDQICHVFSC